MLASPNPLETEIKTHVGSETLQFSKLEYELKLSLKSSTARITSLWMLTNPHLSEQFHRISADKLTLPSWVDSCDLIGGNTEEDVLKRGFQFSSKTGKSFTVGSFTPKGGEGVLHKALLCEILVGRGYAIEKCMASADPLEIPSGYSSLYVQDEQKPTESYSHEYIIKNASQVIPRFLIQFEYDSRLEMASRQKPKCDDCEKELAVVYCDADKAYLCKACDLNLHKTKISKLHIRKPIGEGVDIFGSCKTHPTREVQYFCSQCHEPVCIDCTIMGSHAKAEPGKHTLVSVEDYFRSVLEESKLANPHLIERKNIVTDQISNIQSRAAAVVEMGKHITSKIEDICAMAKRECNQLIEKKLTILMGDEQELRRQTGEIDRLENFLKYQQEGDAMRCVSTWHLHQMCREKLYDFQFFRQEIDVQLDAKISGKLNVVIDQDQASMSATPQVSPVRKSIAGTVRTNTPPPRQRNVRSPDLTMSNTNYLFTNSVPSAPSNYGVQDSRPLSISNPPKFPGKFFKETAERKTERRTSDFFREALTFGNTGSLDDDEDFDSYSQSSSRRL